MVLQVYDADFLMRGDFLGQIVLSSTELFHHAVANATVTLKLQPKESMSEKAKKLVQGTLTFSAKCLSDLPSNAEEDVHTGEDPPELPQGRFAPAVPIAMGLADMHDIKDVVKTDVLTGENPDEKKEAAKAVRTAMMTRYAIASLPGYL